MSELDQLRRQLDAVNARIIDLAAERFALIEQVARWKQSNSIPIVDQDREAEAKAITEQRAIALGLPRGFGASLAELLIEWAKLREAELVGPDR